MATNLKNKLIQSLLPKRKIQWIIAVCWLIFISIDIYIDFFSSFDPMIANNDQFFNHWLLSLIRDIALTVALSSMIIIGIRLIRKEGFSFKRFASPLFAIFFCALLTVVPVFGYFTMAKIKRDVYLPPKVINKKLEECLNKEDLPLKERSRISRLYASNVYNFTGKTIEFITEDGTKKLYEPTQEEIDILRKIDKNYEMMNWTIAGLKRASIIWSTVLIVSLGIGFLSPVKLRKDLPKT